VTARLRGLGRQLLALPSVGWTALFFLAPLVLLVVYSFAQTDLLTYEIKYDWTLSNYSNVFEGLYLDAIVRSLLLSVSATLACLLIGFPVAYTIARTRGRGQPFWTSFIVRTYGIFNLIGDSGPLASLLQTLGLIGDGGLHLLFTPVGIGIGIVYSYLPLMILPLYVALERIDPAVVDAANDLGAPPHRVLWRVILPLAKPGIAAGCILVGIPATGEYVIPQILGGGKTLMIGNVVADQFLSVGDYPFGASLAIVLTIIVMLALVVLRRGERGPVAA
jgi:spermidine/putrescine transport system permease protein